MAQTTAFKFRGKGDETTVCNGCVTTLNLNTANAKEKELNSGKYADIYCLVCGDNITGPGTLRNTKQEIDYPLGITILVDTQFDGVHPVIDTSGNVKEIGPGVKRSVAQRTQHDPVIVKVWPEKTQLLDNIQQFADEVAQLGPIRGHTKTYTDDDGEVTGHDVIFFANQ